MPKAQVQLLSSIYGTVQGDFAVSYPVNCEPVVQDTKIAQGYLRRVAGAVEIGTGQGDDRGGIAWNGQCYRISGTKLIRVAQDDTITVIGDVGAGAQAALDYSFDRLIINSGTSLWYYDGTTLTQVTDVDLGEVNDVIFIDGYTMTTDGKYVVVSDLSDPFSFNPLKYGSSEVDPDPITGLLKFSNEAYALNLNTIQAFRNVGGNGFPFAAQTGATIPKGCCGARAKCLFMDTFAFVGSGRNEALGVYVAGSGTANKISTRAIDDILSEVADPASIILETRTDRDESRLYVRLGERTFCYLGYASTKARQPIWFELASSSTADQPYRPVSPVFANNRWICGDANSNKIGEMSDAVSTQFDELAGWRIDAGLLYNDGYGAILHDLELVGLLGNGPTELQSKVSFSVSKDGITWSPDRQISAGVSGDRLRRLIWSPHMMFSNWLGLRFRGADAALPGWTRCNVDLEPLAL